MSGREQVRLCAATCCHSVIKPGMLMCRDHWLGLPLRLRRAVLSAWRARQISAYRDAVQSAISFHEFAEGIVSDVADELSPGRSPKEGDKAGASQRQSPGAVPADFVEIPQIGVAQ